MASPPFGYEQLKFGVVHAVPHSDGANVGGQRGSLLLGTLPHVGPVLPDEDQISHP
jgi:hypothetical protein